MEMHINNSRTIYAANTSKTVLFLVVAPVRVSFDRVASFCVGRVSSRARRVRSAYTRTRPPVMVLTLLPLFEKMRVKIFAPDTPLETLANFNCTLITFSFRAPIVVLFQY